MRTSGGFGTFQTGGLKTKQAIQYVRNANKWFTGQNVNDGFFYNYWNAAWALVQGLNKSGGRVGRGAAERRCLARFGRASRSPTTAS